MNDVDFNVSTGKEVLELTLSPQFLPRSDLNKNGIFFFRISGNKKKLQNIEDLTKSKYSFEDITLESAHIMEAIKKFRG